MFVSSVLNLHSLRVVVFPGRGASLEKNRAAYEEAFATWKLVWKQTLRELDGNDSLYSDHFTRQDYIVALYHGAKCIALCCFRRANLSIGPDREDSWFKPWPPEDLERFGAENSQGVVLSWLTIHPDYRRSIAIEHIKEFNASDRLCELINLFLQDCRMDVAFGVTRNNRSVNKMSEYVGFKTHRQNAKHHGVDVDLITLVPADLIAAAAKYPSIAFELWNVREVFTNEPLQLLSQEEPKQRLKRVS